MASPHDLCDMSYSDMHLPEPFGVVRDICPHVVYRRALLSHAAATGWANVVISKTRDGPKNRVSPYHM